MPSLLFHHAQRLLQSLQLLHVVLAFLALLVHGCLEV